MLTGAPAPPRTSSLPPQPIAEGRLSTKTKISQNSSIETRQSSAANTLGLVFHIPDLPACRSQDSIASGMHRMMQWYRDNPVPGMRPTFGASAQVSLMDESFPEGPDSFHRLSTFPALKPSLTTAYSSSSSKSSHENINNINFHRNCALAQLEGETSQLIEQNASHGTLSGPLVNFGPDPCIITPETKIHPDLASLIQCFESKPTDTQLQSSLIQIKTPKPMNTQTMPRRKAVPAPRPFDAKVEQLKAPTSNRSSLPVCGPLPEALRIARIEAKAKPKTQAPTRAILPPPLRLSQPEADSTSKRRSPRARPLPLIHGELSSTLQRHPSCLRPCRRLVQPRAPPYPDRADFMRDQIQAATTNEIEANNSIPHELRESTSYLYINCPEPPPETLSPSSYQPYRCSEQSRLILRESVIRKDVQETSRHPQPPPPTKPTVPKYLAYSKTVIRRGTLRELGGRAINISSKEQSLNATTVESSTHQVTIPAAPEADDTSGVVAEFRRLASMEFKSSPIELTTPPSLPTEHDSSLSPKKHEAGPLYKLGRTASKKLHQATTGFGWRRFSDVDYVDPAVEYSQRQKVKRRVQKWRMLNAVHEI